MRQAMRLAWTLAVVLFAAPALGDEAPATAQASKEAVQANAPRTDQGGSSEEAVQTGAPGMEPGEAVSPAPESRTDRDEREFVESVWSAP